MAHPGEEFALRSAAGCGRSSAAQAQRDCPAAPPEVVSSVPVGRRARRAPPPPRPWPSSVPLEQSGGSLLPGPRRRSSVHTASMHGGAAQGNSLRKTPWVVVVVCVGGGGRERGREGVVVVVRTNDLTHVFLHTRQYVVSQSA